MLREIVWQEAGYFGIDEPDKLHHTATLVSQNVTVEHVRAGEVHKLVANPGPAGRHLAVDRLAARRAIRYGDGILPAAPSAGSGSPEEFMPRLRQMAEDAGRDPQSLSVTLGGAPEDIDVLKRNRDLGVTRMNVRLPPAKEGEILSILDRWAKLIPQVRN
jgi:hypothetical protein